MKIQKYLIWGALIILSGCTYHSMEDTVNTGEGSLIGNSLPSNDASFPVPANTNMILEKKKEDTKPSITTSSYADVMDTVDKMKENQGLETGTRGVTITWRNPRTHYVFALTPAEDYDHENGLHCRSYGLVSSLGHLTKTQNLKACRFSSGHWKRV